MVNTVAGSLDTVENMGPKIRGTVENLNMHQGTWRITGENGEHYIFAFPSCIGGADTFNQLTDGMNITFNAKFGTKGEKLQAMNVAIEGVLDTATLAPMTKANVSEIIHPKAMSDTVENMGPKIRGTVENLNMHQGTWRITGENGEHYIFAFPSCIGGADTFNQLTDGMNITFNTKLSTKDGSIQVMNVAIEDVLEDAAA